MNIFLQFLAALVSYDLLRASAPAVFSKLQRRVERRRRLKLAAEYNKHFKPDLETR